MTSNCPEFVTCISSIEMGQWVRRGRIHLLADRILSRNSLNTQDDDFSVFASAEMLKLEDAKARILVYFKKEDLITFSKHPCCKNKEIFDIPIERITGIGPVLKKYKTNLVDYGLVILDIAVDDVWDKWIFFQDSYEKIYAIENLYKKIKIKSNIFRVNNAALQKIIQISQRPQTPFDDTSNVINNWIKLIHCRDEVLQQLRTNGHCGRTSFVSASVELSISLIFNKSFQIALPNENRLDRAINRNDFSEDTILLFCHKANELGFSSPLFLMQLVIYLYAFDEIHYGQKKWEPIIELIKMVRNYSFLIQNSEGQKLQVGKKFTFLNSFDQFNFVNAGDFLLFCTLCNLQTSEINDINFIRELDTLFGC